MTTSKEATSVIVGLGEIKVTQDPSEVLTCLGLGSCIGVSAHDPVAKVAGMAHIVLPQSDGRDSTSPKYADIGVPMLLQELEKHGAIQRRLIVKLAGGAQMSAAKGLGDAFKIGERNNEAVKTLLREQGLKVIASDTGGDYGRTMRLFPDSGKTIVSTAGRETKEI